jgi:hypothetical protein
MATILERLKELDKAANQPTWTLMDGGKNIDGFNVSQVIAATSRGQCVYADPPGGVFPETNRQLIAAMRNALPLLLAVVEAAENLTDCNLTCAGKALAALKKEAV